MIIEAKQSGAGIIPASYQTLSSFEKSLVHLASIIYEPANRVMFAHCLRRAGITGPKGEWLTAATIGPFIQKLQELDLLDGSCRCPDGLVEPASRDAVAAGNFREMAAAVQGEIPFSQYQSKWPQRCLRALREYRIGLYTSDMVQLENMHILLEKYCEDEVVRRFPAVRCCNNPFDDNWLMALAPSVQFYILSQMMNYSLFYLSLLEKPFSYLRSGDILQAIPPEQ